MQPQIYINDERLDLFPDDSINLTQSVQSLRDLTKVFTDFTKSFRVPANDRNNAIFKHYYKSEIDNGFDARTKKPARIDINGVTFKYGKIQLNSVGIKSTVPEFYDIEFFGNTIEIKDLIGDDTLRDLEDLDLNGFDYDSSEVISRLGFNNPISFSLTSYKRRFLWEDTNISTDSEVNIKYNASFTDGIIWNELRGYIKCFEIIKAIESKYGLTFSRDFFLRQEFFNLYMSLGSGTDAQTPYNTTLINTDTFQFYSPSGTPGIFNNARYNIDVTVNSGVEPYRVAVEYNGGRVYESAFVTGSRSFEYDQQDVPFGNIEVKYYIESKAAIDVDVDTRVRTLIFPLGTQNDISNTTSLTIPTPVYEVRSLISDMKVLDWFSAIIKAFNLVIVPQLDGTLYVNDLNSWYYSGGIIDISEYVDISELKVSRGELFKEIAFTYEDTEQILSNEYKSQFGKQFGAEEISLDGLATDETLEIQMPFENIQFERLTDSAVQYAFIVDSTLQPYDNKPFLTYLPTQNNVEIGINTESAYVKAIGVNVPSHSVSLLGGFTAQFAAEYSEFTGGLLDDNLYSRFYSDYFGDLFSTKRRKYELTAHFNPTLLSKIAMNDRLIINGVRYLIDNAETNILNGKTKLTLLNDIFESLFIGEESSAVNAKFGIYTDSGAVSYTGSPYAVVSSPQDWITPTINGGLVSFTLDANKDGSDRAGVIQIEDGLSNPTITILQPFDLRVTWDNNNITFDNNNITF